MNKKDIVVVIASEYNLSMTHAEGVVDSVFAQIECALMKGDVMRLSGIGTFKRVATKARIYRNPHTGEAIDVPAGHKIKFKASPNFAEGQ